MKRSFPALLLAICMFIALCSCGESQIPETVPEYGGDIREEDFDLLGYEYIISAITHGSVYPLNPTSGDTARGDQLLLRYKEAEEKYNCKITIRDGSDVGTFLTYYAANIKYSDLMFNAMHQIIRGKYLQNGYFMPFSDMDIDLESGLYGTPAVLEAGNFKGDYYSIIAYYWGFPAADTAPAMWFNPRVISNFQQTSPHELDEMGEWTWDTLEKMCEAIRDTSNPDENMQTYALAYTNLPYLELGALYSNGARAVTKDESGRLYYSFNDQRALEALDFTHSLAARDLICNGGDRQNIEPFVENRRAFFLEYTHMGLSDEGTQNLSYLMNDAYEWIYFPAGPSYVPGTPRTAYSYNSRLFYAPLNSDAEVHSILLPFLFQPLPGETAETWQDDFKRVTFFTEESFEYFTRLRDDAFFDYLVYSSFSGDFEDKLVRMTRGTLSISETLESLESNMQSALDTYYNDYLE
ncbi:MAG: extracellular solute-binding protein [Clostridia bacterium]|nr:extracellular solute-binding protein [Clostridia bacterium]